MKWLVEWIIRQLELLMLHQSQFTGSYWLTRLPDITLDWQMALGCVLD